MTMGREKTAAPPAASNTGGKPPRNSRPTTQMMMAETPHSNINNRYIFRGGGVVDPSDGDASSEFFSPPGPADEETLPRAHDTSWIGARQSPIPSFDDEVKTNTPVSESDDEEEEEIGENDDATEKYHRALHESMKKFDYFYHGQDTDETAHLLESGRRHEEYLAIPRNESPHQQHRNVPSNIHPLWNGANSEERERNAEKYAKYYTKGNNKQLFWGWKWGHALLLVSACGFLGMSAYECMAWFQAQNGNVAGQWDWVYALWQPRSVHTIVLFGGIHTDRVLNQNQYWRLLTAPFVCASLPEWILLLLCWTSAIYNNPTYRSQQTTWFGTFVGSSLVGQLWMMAWDGDSRAATAATWGTCGVLTAFGVDRPNCRDVCFLASTLLILQAWWELPCNSVFGVVGASCFGWLLSATASAPDLRTCPKLFISIVRMIILLAFVLAPVMSIALESSE